MADRGVLQARNDGGSAYGEAERVANELQRLSGEKSGLVGAGKQEQDQVNRFFALYGYRNQIPAILNMIDRCILAYAKDQPQFGATEAERSAVIANLRKIPRADRKMITLESVDFVYLPDVRKELPNATGDARRGWKVMIRGRTPLRKERVSTELVAPINRISEQMAAAPLDGNVPSPIRLVLWQEPRYFDLGGPAPAAVAGATPTASVARIPDPLMVWANPAGADANAAGDATEDIANDTGFDIVWILEIAKDKNGKEIDGLPTLSAGQ
jgi:hypothetical protein